MCDIITPGTYYKKGYYTHWSSIEYTPPPPELKQISFKLWCLDNLEGKVCITTRAVCFELESDLMAFKLGYE